MAKAWIEYPQPPPAVEWKISILPDDTKTAGSWFKYVITGKSLLTGATFKSERRGYTSRVSAAEAAEETARKTTDDHRAELDVKDTWTLTL